MTVGIDTSVIVPCVHANHPLHVAMAGWLNTAFERDRVVVAHHSLIEAYAVLTRLPPEYRLSPAETLDVLRGSLRDNAEIAPFDASRIWSVTEELASVPAAGGTAYDAFIIRILVAAGVDAIATSNAQHFRRLTADTRVIDPLQ